MIPYPREELEAYVRAMPQGEAQTALIVLLNYIADLEAAQWRACQAAGLEVT